MIRVAIIAGVLHYGGKRSLIMEYYRHIDRTKLQFDFICDSDSNGIPEDEIKSLGGEVYKVAPYKHIIPHMIDTYKILKNNNYRVMHAFDNTLNIFPMFVGWLVGVNVRISESISKGNIREKKTLIKYLLRPFSHWFVTDFIANSIDCGIWQFGKRAYKKGRINIFKSIIDTVEYSFDNRLRETTRKRYHWENEVVYGYIGRYVPQKNPLFLIDIFYEISKRQENARLVMIGFGEMDEKLHIRINGLGLRDKVTDLGRTDDVRPFYNAFDAFLLPSLYEGMPIVGIEAQCVGLPIFFSKNITKETTACDLAHYIGLEQHPSVWAEQIINIVINNIDKRRSYATEVKAMGFDSQSEARRLENMYCNALKTL